MRIRKEKFVSRLTSTPPKVQRPLFLSRRLSLKGIDPELFWLCNAPRNFSYRVGIPLKYFSVLLVEL